MAKCYAKNVIKVAEKYVGYLEKNSNSYLDDFKKNAGNKNYNRFAVEYKKFTGLNLQANAWCDIFCDTVFIEAFGIVNAKRLLGGFNAYTPSSANLFKSMDRWYISNPKIGDVIFFKNSERINHTGIVIDVSNTKVYTIEGNTSSGTEVIENGGGVFRKEYFLANQRIAGYGRPNYDVEAKPIVKPIVKKVNPYKQPINTVKNGMKGNDVSWVQFELLEAGIDTVLIDKKIKKLKIDGDFGDITEAAVKVFQTKYKLEVDGKVGGITRNKFIEK